MLIAVDVDGVVCDLHTAWLDLYNKDYADTLTPEDITTWEMDPHVKPECGERIYEYLRHPDLYKLAPPVMGALAGVAGLRSNGHRVVFATSCVPGGMWDRKLDWLIRHGFLKDNRTNPDYIAVTDKSLVRANMLIDDRLDSARDFPGLGMLFDQPWNQTDDAYPALRARGWKEVVRYAGGA